MPPSGTRCGCWTLDRATTTAFLHGLASFLAHTPITIPVGSARCRRVLCGREEEQVLDDAIKDIASLLALAYKRRARIPVVRTALEQIPASLHLANADKTSVNELRLTSMRKESTQL